MSPSSRDLHGWFRSWFRGILWFGATAALVACGGGGGGASSQRAFLTGTASKGAPILGATVTVKDHRGESVTTRTSPVDGTYAIDVQALVPPYLVRVDDGSVDGLFSVGTQPGVVNVHPFTNLLVVAYYQSHGTTPAAAFPALGLTTPMPSRSVVKSLTSMFERVLEPMLAAYGVAVPDFDIIATPLVADGHGLDAILDATTTDHGSDFAWISIDDSKGATATWTWVQIGVDPDSGWVYFGITMTTTASEVRLAQDSVFLVRDDDAPTLEAAVAGVAATLEQFVAVVDARGSGLVGSDLVGFFAADYLNDGADRVSDAAHIAADEAGLPLVSRGVQRVVSYSAADGRIAVKFALTTTLLGKTAWIELPDSDDDGMNFARQEDGSWKLLGNRRVAGLRTVATHGSDFAMTSPGLLDPIVHDEFRCEAWAPFETLNDVAVTGTFPDLGYLTEQLVDAGDAGRGDLFVRANSTVTSFPWGGAPFDYAVHPIGSDLPKIYPQKCRGCSSESLRIVAYDDVAFADAVNDPLWHSVAFLHPGTPFKIAWTALQTFAVGKISVYADVDAGLQSATFDADGVVTNDATAAVISLPPDLFGTAIDAVRVHVEVKGRNGEEVWLSDAFTRFR